MVVVPSLFPSRKQLPGDTASSVAGGEHRNTAPMFTSGNWLRGRLQLTDICPSHKGDTRG